MAAPSCENVPTVFIEVRQQIRAVQVVLQIQTSCDEDKPCQDKCQITPSTFQVEVLPHSLNINLWSDKSCDVFQLNGIKLLPKTCNGLHWVPEEGLHMRLQVAEGHSKDTREVSEAREKEECGFLSQASCILTCGMCRAKIALNQCTFDRVLPLPSENWRELSENWCCHGNKETGRFANQSLLPSDSDCLVGALYILLHPSMLCKEAFILRRLKTADAPVTRKESSLSLLCRRCRSSLGEGLTKGADSIQRGQEWQAIHSVKLFKHSLHIRSCDEQLNLRNSFSCYNTETYLAQHLASLSQMHATFKFIIEKEASQQQCLLVWLLSADTLLLTSDALPLGQLGNHFHGNQSLPSCCSSSSFKAAGRDKCCCTPRQRVKTHDMNAHKIVKVLYQTQWDQEWKSVYQQWSKDLSIQAVPLPKTTCLELMMLLADSNQHTPASLRQMNGFKVGYLRL
ncbi:E3 ubiquitin-protein ligase E3D-like isoform X2 [Asterias rubens]|uniref:E3 ubiquitin-protein ligase E3D-like isoform X2 n=1 Tax=Asterias rubens TaxID=7604 RepID=UPI0014557F08|nr:E3 ubiquitin-protein ligase E3D-like isoform X2 [Asterias rubens]